MPEVNEQLYGVIKTEVENNKSTTPMAKASAIFRAISMIFQSGFRLDENAVVAAALYAWDNLVVPYDVPYVPAGIERAIEKRLRTLLEASVRMLVQQFPADPNEEDPFGNAGPMGAAAPVEDAPTLFDDSPGDTDGEADEEEGNA